MYIYIYVYIHMYIYICTYIYIYMNIYMELQRRMFADCRFRIWGFIFQGSHFRFLGTAIVFRLPNLGFRVWGMLDAWVLFCGFRVYSFTCFGFRVSDIVFEHSSFMFQVTDFCILIRSCRFPILHFVICCLHVRFPVLGFRYCISSLQLRIMRCS